MKERIGNYLNTIRSDEQLVRRMYLVTLVFALFLASLTIKGGLESGKYIVNKNGSVVGIERRSLSSYEEYPLKVTIRSSGDTVEKDVIISKRSVKEESTSEKTSTAKEERQTREAELNQLLSEIEASSEKQISLPTELSDGSQITWQKGERWQGERTAFLLLYIVLIGILLYGKFGRKGKQPEKERESLLRGLPRFVNQLVMMLHAGVILSDSFDRICQSYEMIPSSSRSYFESEMVSLYELNLDHQVGTAMILNNYAGLHNAKEMLRISTILLENERRGSDVVESLSRESRFLWESRKIVAEEKGKSIDTKMAGPLAILLILLIVITMAPAMLAM